MLAEPSRKLQPMTPFGSMATGAENVKPVPPSGCAQTVWLSFFFDGTGNNLDADVGTQKHSNVAKLYTGNSRCLLGSATGSVPSSSNIGAEACDAASHVNLPVERGTYQSDRPHFGGG